MAGTFAEGLSRLSRTPGFKFFLIAVLIFLLSIPLVIVYFLVEERSSRSSEVAREIAGEWGGSQAIRGPYLIVPYTVKTTVLQGDKRVDETVERRAVFLPDALEITGDAKSEIRQRSIYDVTVYTANLTLKGRFGKPDITLVEPDAVAVRWRDAVIAIGIQDVSGLKNAAALDTGGRSIPFEPSIGIPNANLNGIHARLYGAPGATASIEPDAFDFSIGLTFNGSSDLNFAPVARETRVSLASDWRHPSFSGAYLPASRDVSATGFTASWTVPHLARSVPQAWSEGGLPGQQQYAAAGYTTLDRFQSYLFGVKFYIPVDYYDLVTRAAKYGLAFLAVAFGALLVLELRSPVRVHAVQYIFVGLAMIFFYVLLLSLSEHIGFLGAYLLSAVATGGMLSAYAAKALQDNRKGLIMLVVFLLLYGLLYLILRLEDYALLAGAVAGFIMLTVTMFFTLRVNWSSDEPQPYRP